LVVAAAVEGGEFGVIAGVAGAFGVTGATAMQRRKQGSAAGEWCDEAVTGVMASRT